MRYAYVGMTILTRHRLVAEITRATGRRYSIKLEALDDESLREFQRLLRDLDHEEQMAVQQGRLQPWRR